jgi:DNA end-binding protein Ku
MGLSSGRFGAASADPRTQENHMPRAIWSGSISFGLVNIPVKLCTAVSRKSVRFNQLDSETGTRIKQRRINPDTGEEVSNDQIVKGYELGEGRYLTVSDEELASLDPVAGRTIDLQEFVLQSEIDPVFYDSAYYLVPDPVAKKAYALLVHAMEEADRVGVARFVMRTKQYLAAMRVRDGHLMLSTMVYNDELNAAEDLDGLEGLCDVELTDAELQMAEQLIESLASPFEPAKYQDTYRNQVLELIDRKDAGEEIVVSAEGPTQEKVIDLMAALEASVATAKESRKRHPAAAAKAKTQATKTTSGAKKSALTTKKTAAKKTAAKKPAPKKPARKVS